MHELGMATEILHAVHKEALRLNGQGPIRKVGVRIGELAAVDPEALQFSFEALRRDSDFESLELEIEFCPVRYRCPQCNETFPVVNYAIECPVCKNPQTEFVSGDEMELAYLEVDDHEPIAAGR